MLRVLETFGIEHLNEPEKLKFVLAPIIAHSPREQDRFHKVFEDFLKQDLELAPPAPKPEKQKPSFIHWLWAALVLIPLVWLFLKQKQSPESLSLLCPSSEVALGDTLSVALLNEQLDTAKYEYNWTLTDVSSSEVEMSQSQLKEWKPRIQEVGNSPYKIISLEIKELKDGTIVQALSCELSIVCPVEEQPKIEAIRLEPEDVRVGIPIRFEPEVKDGPYVYEWDFGGDTLQSSKNVIHTFESSGTHSVSLSVRDSSQLAICETIKRLEVTIDEEPEQLALLGERKLEKDEGQVKMEYKAGVWAFLLIPLLWVLFSWYRWRRFKKKKEEEKKAAASDQIALPVVPSQKSRRPFFIPFQDQNKHILHHPSEKRLAEALRLRKEGLRRVLDVPMTLDATIAQGGFPAPQYRYSQQASEYLFLVDRQSANSHQADLFRYLIGLVQEQEAYIETYYYDQEFYRFWNEDHPEGMDLDVLQRRYLGHRLIILGDAHALLEVAGSQHPGLKENYAAALRSWPQQLLITPFPPRSWTYRELILSRHLAIFPADTDGLDAAATFIEMGLEKEDLPPTFQEWQKQWEAIRADADTNYVDWEDIDDLEDHFAERKGLFQWLSALAVYPKPNWSLTLSIGQALAARGVVALNYDNLLQLSRVEWLQTGILDQGLRAELLEELEEDNEQVARMTVAAELKAINEQLPRDSHAADDLASGLAVQHFYIDPDATDNQEALRILLQKELLSPDQIEELNQRLQLHRQQHGLGNEATDIHTFVNQQAEKEVSKEKERNPYLWPAILASSALLFAFLFLWFSNRPDYLARMNASALVVKKEDLNQAARLNNEGVDAYFQFDLPQIMAAFTSRPNNREVADFSGFRSPYLFIDALQPGSGFYSSLTEHGCFLL